MKNYIGKFCTISQYLSDIRCICKNWWWIYNLLSKIEDKHLT